MKDLWMFLVILLLMILLVSNVYSKESFQDQNGFNVSHYSLNVPIDSQFSSERNINSVLQPTEKHLLEPCMKIFIASMSLEVASLTTTIFEFSFIAAAIPLSIIGWVLFGIGIGLALIAFMLAIGKCMVVHQIKKSISKKSIFYN